MIEWTIKRHLVSNAEELRELLNKLHSGDTYLSDYQFMQHGASEAIKLGKLSLRDSGAWVDFVSNKNFSGSFCGVRIEA